MKLRERYSRLSLWNKIAFWGSLCSIVALIVAPLLWFISQKPKMNVYFVNIFNEVESLPQNSAQEPLVTRTFWLLHEKGASISLGPCPSNQCFHISLGELKQEGNILVQSFILSGAGFSFFSKRTEVQVGDAVEGSITYGIDDNFIMNTANTSIIIRPNREVIINMPLAKGAQVTIVTKSYDIKFIVLDRRSDSLRIKLEVSHSSGRHNSDASKQGH
jgi:hypothetical protein